MGHIMVTSQEAAETKLDSKSTEKPALTGSKAKAGNSEAYNRGKRNFDR